jgi:hypothetical protein
MGDCGFERAIAVTRAAESGRVRRDELVVWGAGVKEGLR